MELDKLNLKNLSQEQDKFLFEFVLGKDTGLFEGHFPDFPLLPGVVQIDLVMKLFEKYRGQKIKFLGFRNVKFFNPIFPDKIISLQFNFEPTLGRINFEYKMDDRPCSKGTVEVAHV